MSARGPLHLSTIYEGVLLRSLLASPLRLQPMPWPAWRATGAKASREAFCDYIRLHAG